MLDNSDYLNSIINFKDEIKTFCKKDIVSGRPMNLATFVDLVLLIKDVINKNDYEDMF